MNYYKVFTFLLLTIFSCSLNGQVDDYNFRYFTIKDGLSHDIVRSVIQDDKGFIWAGTDLGLNRFDGQEFKVFTKRKNGLPNNVVRKITEDRQGKLWLNFNAALHLFDNKLLSIFDPETEQSLFFEDYFQNIPFQKEDIHVIESDKEKNIWIITNQGLIYRYQKTFELIAENESYKKATAIKIFSKNEIWIGVDKNLIKLNSKGEELKRIKTSSEIITNFGKLPSQKIWVENRMALSISPSLEIFDQDRTKSFYRTNFEISSPKRINSRVIFDKDKRSRFWHFGVDAFFSTDSNGENIIDFYPEIVNGFRSINVNDFFLDKFNNTWVATGRGLVLISPKDHLFQTFLIGDSRGQGIFSLRGIEEIDDKNIIAATYNGFYLIDKVTGDSSHLSTVQWLTKKKGWGLGMITIGDEIFSGCHGTSFWKIDKKTKKIELKILDVPKRLEVINFFQDQYQQVWVCTTNGLHLLDLKDEQIHRPPNADLENEFYQMKINSVFEDEDELLICTEKGLFIIDHKGVLLEDFDYLSQFQINHIHQTVQDVYWLATKGSGLILWNRKENSIRQFSKEQGLSHDYIYSITEDEFGYFWLPSNNGLMRFNPKDFSVNTFNENDGLAHREFNTHSRLKGKDDRLYFGGVNGITAFYPKDFELLEKQNIPLILSEVKKVKEGEVQFIRSTKINEDSKELHFNMNDKAISLGFCLLDYPNSFQSKYAYKIEGYENEWKYLESNRLIINRLPFGDYKLKVKAQGSYGTWTNHVLEFPINVIKPFYLKWQFLILAILAMIGVIYGFARWRINQLEKKNLALESIVADRTKELADLNELKDQFFAIIAHDMRGLVLSFKNISQKVNFLQRKGRANEVESFLQGVDKSAESLSYLLDNLLDWALVEKGVFPHHPELFNVEKLILENIKLFTQLSRIKEVRLSYEVPETLNLYADKNAISTIVRNLINNAIKFSSTGDEVIIVAAKNEGQIQIQVKDTGIGIASAKLKNIFELGSEKRKQGTRGEQGSGLGLLLCKELVTLNQGEIRIESEEGKGTNILIGFPLVA